MKNLLFLLIIAASTVSFYSCNNVNNSSAWENANKDAYNAITKNTDYKEVLTATGPTGVYRKIINTGTGTEYPLQTSRVKALYQGTYYDGTFFDPGTSQSNIPDTLRLDGTMYNGAVAISRGLSFAIQQMQVGDKWEIWVPYYLGYGDVDYYTTTTYTLFVKAYSTLVYQVELVDITQYP